MTARCSLLQMWKREDRVNCGTGSAEQQLVAANVAQSATEPVGRAPDRFLALSGLPRTDDYGRERFSPPRNV